MAQSFKKTQRVASLKQLATNLMVVVALAVLALFVAPVPTQAAEAQPSPLDEIIELLEGARFTTTQEPEVKFSEPKRVARDVVIKYEVVTTASDSAPHSFASESLTPYIGKVAKLRVAGQAEQNIIIGSTTQNGVRIGSVELTVGEKDATKGSIVILNTTLPGVRTTITPAANRLLVSAAPAAQATETTSDESTTMSEDALDTNTSSTSSEQDSTNTDTGVVPPTADELRSLANELSAQIAAAQAAAAQANAAASHNTSCNCAACLAAATDTSSSAESYDTTDTDATTTSTWDGRIPPRTPDVVGSEYAGGAGTGGGTWLIPATGDDTNLVLPIVLGGSAAALVLAAILMRNKKK